VVADNAVKNDATVIVNIAGNNHAPINVVVETVTRIVNTGTAIAVTGAELVGSAWQALTGSAGGHRGDGAVVSNDVQLGSDVTLRVAGDNRTPVRIVVEIAASLWNRGLALLGGATPSDDNTTANATAGTGSAAATGLTARNRINLWGRVFVEILGDNYAPIDISIRLVSDTVNTGFALARSAAASAPEAPAPADRTARTQSGAASCLGTATIAVVGNIQTATVMTPKDESAKRAANAFAAAVKSSSLVGCASGSAAGRSMNVLSGAVDAQGSVSQVQVGSVQNADASAVTKPAAPAPADDTTAGTRPTGGSVTTTPRGAVRPVVEISQQAPHRLARPPSTPVRRSVRMFRPIQRYGYWYYEDDLVDAAPQIEEMPLQTLSTSGELPEAVSTAAASAPITQPAADLAPVALALIALALLLLSRLGLRRLGPKGAAPVHD